MSLVSRLEGKVLAKVEPNYRKQTREEVVEKLSKSQKKSADNSGKIVCEICGKNDFTALIGLNGHMRLAHPDVENINEIAAKATSTKKARKTRKYRKPEVAHVEEVEQVFGLFEKMRSNITIRNDRMYLRIEVDGIEWAGVLNKQ